MSIKRKEKSQQVLRQKLKQTDIKRSQQTVMKKPHEHTSKRPRLEDKDPNELPNTFKFAAETLELMNERGGSVGSIVVNKYKSYNYKLIFALVMNTLKNIKIIKKIIHNLKLANQVKENNTFILEILVGDLLFGQKLKSVEQNPLAAAILGRKDQIEKEQHVLRNEFTKESSDQSEAKYLRINSLKTDMAHTINQLKGMGLTQVEYEKSKIKFRKFINKFKAMSDNEFMLDFHFPDELVLLKSVGADKVKKSDLWKKSKVTLQDKASYLAVEAMGAEPGHKVIDACFAPGCKTTLIAAKMRNKGKILAYDINKSRLVPALRFLKLHGASCVKAELLDFSKVKLTRLPKIHNLEYFDSILIDPSCSGSGIKTRIDYKRTAQEAGRLKKLQAFQVSLLKHALKARMSKSIVYCTCSSSVEENEQVIEMALNESGVKSKWDVEEVIPYWPCRGEKEFEFGPKCLRSDSEHLTNGFFIAKLNCNELYQPPAKNVNKKKGQEQHESADEADADAASDNGEADTTLAENETDEVPSLAEVGDNNTDDDEEMSASDEEEDEEDEENSSDDDENTDEDDD